MPIMSLAQRVAWAAALTCMAASPAAAQPKSRPYRLPDLGDAFKDRVIWGSQAESPDGKYALAFGGQDQESEDGRPHTRVRVDGQWVDVSDELRRANPLRDEHDEALALIVLHRSRLAERRSGWFEGRPYPQAKPPAQRGDQVESFTRRFQALKEDLEHFEQRVPRLGSDVLARAAIAANALRLADALVSRAAKEGPALSLRFMMQADVALGRCADALAAEPPPRALSPLVYEPKTGLFLLFGGDHLDYLTNDLWAFDPRQRRWSPWHLDHAPPPRANHDLDADGKGNIIMRYGYEYASNTDYVGGQYRDRRDNWWTLDTEARTWESDEPAGEPWIRVYRSGPFHPWHYTQAPPPDREAVTATLAALPPNTWTKLNPPHLPRLNRDWGTAVLDPERDLILRWSGGHSAHGGTDVLHYHLATNRWELCYPVEFPLGQLYANTRYPRGFNFNKRPWITGHTYKSYAVDPVSRKMLFVGRNRHMYYYDPGAGDWTGTRQAKPPGMNYNSSFYTLFMRPLRSGAAKGVVCWTKDGRLFHYDGKADAWTEWELNGDKLPGSVVDRAGLVHDTKRDRLILFSKPYRGNFLGDLYTVDVKTRRVSKSTPAGAAGMKGVGFLREPVYDPEHDLVFIGANLPLMESEPRRTPAYDCARQRWIALELAGDDPSGKRGRNVSLGLVYDTKRKLYWAVDTNSQVYVMKLDMKSAKLTELE